MSKGIIGAVLETAGKGVTAIGLEKLRADTQAMRDKTLHQYAMQQQGAAQKFQADQAEKERTFRSQEAGAQRTFEAEQRGADRQVTLEWQGMQYMQSEAERRDRQKLLEAQMKQIGIQSEAAQLNLDSAKDLRKAYEIVQDPNLTAEQRATAAEYINLVNPKSTSKFVFQQKEDEFGNKTDEWVVGNTRTGELYDMGKPGALPTGGAGTGGGSNPLAGNPEAEKIKAEYTAGKISRDEAYRRLSELDGSNGGAGAQDGTAPEASASGSGKPAPAAATTSPAAADVSRRTSAEDAKGPEQPLFRVGPPRKYDPNMSTAENAYETFIRPLEDRLNANNPVRARLTGADRSGIVAARRGEPGSKKNPVKPESTAEVSKLPQGAWYIDPEDGELRQVS